MSIFYKELPSNKNDHIIFNTDKLSYTDYGHIITSEGSAINNNIIKTISSPNEGECTDQLILNHAIHLSSLSTTNLTAYKKINIHTSSHDITQIVQYNSNKNNSIIQFNKLYLDEDKIKNMCSTTSKKLNNISKIYINNHFDIDNSHIYINLNNTKEDVFNLIEQQIDADDKRTKKNKIDNIYWLDSNDNKYYTSDHFNSPFISYPLDGRNTPFFYSQQVFYKNIDNLLSNYCASFIGFSAKGYRPSGQKNTVWKLDSPIGTKYTITKDTNNNIIWYLNDDISTKKILIDGKYNAQWCFFLCQGVGGVGGDGAIQKTQFTTLYWAGGGAGAGALVIGALCFNNNQSYSFLYDNSQNIIIKDNADNNKYISVNKGGNGSKGEDGSGGKAGAGGIFTYNGKLDSSDGRTTLLNSQTPITDNLILLYGIQGAPGGINDAISINPTPYIPRSELNSQNLFNPYTITNPFEPFGVVDFSIPGSSYFGSGGYYYRDSEGHQKHIDSAVGAGGAGGYMRHAHTYIKGVTGGIGALYISY